MLAAVRSMPSFITNFVRLNTSVPTRHVSTRNKSRKRKRTVSSLRMVISRLLAILFMRATRLNIKLIDVQQYAYVYMYVMHVRVLIYIYIFTGHI